MMRRRDIRMYPLHYTLLKHLANRTQRLEHPLWVHVTNIKEQKQHPPLAIPLVSHLMMTTIILNIATRNMTSLLLR